MWKVAVCSACGVVVLIGSVSWMWFVVQLVLFVVVANRLKIV